MLLLFQPVAALDHFALRRSPGAYPAAFGPRLKIGIAFCGAHFFNQSGNAYLPLQFFPEKNQAGTRIFFQLLSFITIVIGEEYKSAFVIAFQ